MGSEYEDGPNFSYAYGGSSDKASWNPALRPDTDNDEDALLLTDYSKASEATSINHETILFHSKSDAIDPPAPAAESLSAAQSNHTFDEEPTSEDDFFDRYGGPTKHSQSNTQAPVDQVEEREPVSTSEHVSVASEHGVGGLQMSHGDAGISNGLAEESEDPPAAQDEHQLNGSLQISEEHPPAENYEHQGETTELEEAMNEDVKVPLVEDSEEPVSMDWATSGEVFDLGGKPQDGPIQTSQTDTDRTDLGPTQEIREESKDIDWGAGEDVDFFGATNGQTNHIAPAEPIEGDSGVHLVQDGDKVEKSTQQGDASMWDLALDDDFLPDTEESPETVAPFLIDDDEGFLEDISSQPAPEPTQSTQRTSGTASRYAPAAAQVSKPTSHAYGVQAPQFTDFSQLNQRTPITAANLSYAGYNQSQPQQQERPSMPSSAQSFAAKAKGGYSSPYDLPEDIGQTRRRPAPRQVSIPNLQQATQPPPRSSSIYSNATAGSARPPPPSNMSAASLSPPSSSHSLKSPMSGMPGTAPPKPAAPSKKPSSEFFAELPVVSKPRAVPSGRYTPQGPAQTASPPSSYQPSHLPPKNRTGSWSSLRNEVLPESNPLISQLQAPEKLPVFPDLQSQSPQSSNLPIQPPAAAPTPNTSRYSPAPPSIPAANSRYSPAPPPQASAPRYSPVPPQAAQGPAVNKYASEPAGPPKNQSFAPRTSSPLAYQTIPNEEPGTVTNGTDLSPPSTVPAAHAVQTSDGSQHTPYGRPLEEVREMEEQEAQPSRSSMTARSETPPLRSSPSSTVGSPRKRVQNYTPQYQSGPPPLLPNMAPQRSQSQSPGLTMKSPVGGMPPLERATTVHNPLSPTTSLGGQNIANIIPHKRGFSHEFDYIAPTDERAADPLCRWKGYPIFKWGLGGTMVTSFPKNIPRYGGGSSMPMMKTSPGEVKIQSIKETFPLTEDIAKFPGPLKSKSKKKDVSAWLGRKVEALENEFKMPGFDQRVAPEVFKRFEERILLWKIMQVFVDNDGRLEVNSAAELAVRKVLAPGDDDTPSDRSASFATGADLVGISRSNTVQADFVEPRAVDELRNLLTKGDREKAVWHAVDQGLWAHAMLLSSTLNKDIWKQVVQEFVRKEVKKLGGNTQSLAFLYEIFAGNWEDCIDQLVPASARAGFQMVSTDGNANRNALEGLDRWRETLSLILNNRSDGDVQALISLGRLLAGYGRIEAAHICFIFARSATFVGGLDDPSSDVVLVGADHRNNPLGVGRDLEPILLTEVYEFALSLSATSSTPIIPHLQSFKLAHAYTLAEYGHKSEAQQYCDAIFAAMKSTTRPSPYYNGTFISSLDDLTKRLSQSPKDGSSSWISKPSMDKVSGSLLAKFNSFIAGDDSDVASNHSGNGEVGPFGKIAGNTPTISPSQSNADLYGAYSGYQAGGVAPPPSAPPANSRYAPSNAYAPRSSLEQTRGRYDPQGRPSIESADGSSGVRRASENHMPSSQMSGPYTPQYSPPSSRTQAPRSQSAYSPNKVDQLLTQPTYSNPYQPSPPAEAARSFSYQPPQSTFDTEPSSPPPEQSSDAYEPPSMGYEPPTSSYEPPSHDPYQPDADDEEETKPAMPKKKSFMDDDEDDDLAQKAAELKKKQRAEADRKADEAFRKAAEADAAKSKDGGASGEKKGWFGGWFGKKDPNAAPGPIKAKLGEENSFYYDPELKKWVNKKGGSSAATPAMSTPPPPKSGPPSRSISGNSVVANHALGQLGSSVPNSLSMSAPPSRPPTSNPPRSSSMPPPPSRSSTPGIPSDTENGAPPLQPPKLGASGPPSRPGTGMSNASSIEDLIGAPAARKGGTIKGKKRGGRYVDVMAQK